MRFNLPRASWAFLLLPLGCGAGEPQPGSTQPGTTQPGATSQPGTTQPNGGPQPNGGTPGLAGQNPSTATPLASNTPPARGARSCSTFDERSSFATGDWTPWSGCSCTPDAQRLRDREHCGMFPCAEQGCYVQPCKADTDCAVGLCANFLGRPRGYCVTDDPK